MNKNFLLAFLGLFLIVSIPLVHAEYMGAGHEDTLKEKAEREMAKDISISLNKDSFTIGQTAIISLDSSTLMRDMKIEMSIYDDRNNQINRWIIPIDNTERILQKFEFGKSDFEREGTYILMASYGDATDRTQFTLSFPDSKANPQTSLNDVNQRFEGLNERDGEKDRMIAELQAENAALNSRLDTLTAVLQEQTQVLLQLSRDISNLKGIIGEWLHFDFFA